MREELLKKDGFENFPCANDGYVLADPRREHILWDDRAAQDRVAGDVQENIAGFDRYATKCLGRALIDESETLAIELVVKHVLAANE